MILKIPQGEREKEKSERRDGLVRPTLYHKKKEEKINKNKTEEHTRNRLARYFERSLQLQRVEIYTI